MKSFLYKLKQKLFPGLIRSEEYVNHLRNVGIQIGQGTMVYDASSVRIDESRPHMLQIGEYCKITGGTVILAHDYSRSVLRRKYGEIIAEAKKTIIGNNVFIGMNSIILMGSVIGSNSIVGAGSVVGGVFPDEVVIAGNPAKIIMSLEEFYEKRKNRYIDDAYTYFVEFRRNYGKSPSIEDMNSFFPLYLDRKLSELRKYKLRTRLGGDCEDEVIRDFLKTEKHFESYEAFTQYCLERESKEGKSSE